MLHRVSDIALSVALAAGLVAIWSAAFAIVSMDDAQAQPAQVTPFTCAITSVTTGGTPVTPISGRVNGGIIANPLAAAGTLYVNQVGTASSSAPTAADYPLAPGQSWFVVPGSTKGVSVVTAASTQPFFCIFW